MSLVNEQQYISALNGVGSGTFIVKRTSDEDLNPSMISAEIIKSAYGKCLTYSEITGFFHPINSICGILPTKYGQLTLNQYNNQLQIYNSRKDKYITIYDFMVPDEIKQTSALLYGRDIMTGSFNNDNILTLTKYNNDEINIKINMKLSDLSFDNDGIIIIEDKQIKVLSFPDKPIKLLAYYNDKIQWIEPSIIQPEQNYFRLTALDNDCIISLNTTNNDIVKNLKIQYNINKTGWQIYNINSILLLNKDEYIEFYNNSQSFSQDEDNYLYFNLNGNFKASNNIISLLNFKQPTAYCFYKLFNNCKTLQSIEDINFHSLTNTACYKSMFQNCTAITIPPLLPATSLSSYCYSNMFKNCINLRELPILNSNYLKEYCYQNMFYNCISLTSVIDLPIITIEQRSCEGMFMNCSSITNIKSFHAQTLADYCYKNMFTGCTNLSSIPALHVTDLKEQCYEQMFKDCINLNTITAYFETWQEPVKYTSAWVKNVGPTGIFYKYYNLPEIYDDDHIPYNWQIKNIDNAGLCFTALEDSSICLSACFEIYESSPSCDTPPTDKLYPDPITTIQYRILNKTNWINYIEDTPISTFAGEIIEFKNTKNRLSYRNIYTEGTKFFHRIYYHQFQMSGKYSCKRKY